MTVPRQPIHPEEMFAIRKNTAVCKSIVCTVLQSAAVQCATHGFATQPLEEAVWVQDVGEGPLEMKVVRSRDFQEVAVMHGGRCVLRGAQAYGFRNIQNLMRKIRSGKCPYDVVEVMACPAGAPSGCRSSRRRSFSFLAP